MVDSKSAKSCPGSHGDLCLEQQVMCLSGDVELRMGLFYVVIPTIRTTIIIL